MTSDQDRQAEKPLPASVKDALLDIRAIALGARLLIMDKPEDRDTGLNVARLLEKIVDHADALIGVDKTQTLHD